MFIGDHSGEAIRGSELVEETVNFVEAEFLAKSVNHALRRLGNSEKIVALLFQFFQKRASVAIEVLLIAESDACSSSLEVFIRHSLDVGHEYLHHLVDIRLVGAAPVLPAFLFLGVILAHLYRKGSLLDECFHELDQKTGTEKGSINVENRHLLHGVMVALRLRSG